MSRREILDQINQELAEFERNTLYPKYVFSPIIRETKDNIEKDIAQLNQILESKGLPTIICNIGVKEGSTDVFIKVNQICENKHKYTVDEYLNLADEESV
jgi:hypothetical protein